MFTMAKKDDMGQYLEKLIYQKYPSVRQFGADCLREEHAEVNDETLRKRSNRLSQIIHGKKSIQVADLPIFSKLLEVSCEEILGASKCGAPADGHLDNYKVAASKDHQVWEKYANLQEGAIRNADEYGKTVVDYALEFRNYGFLKYMMQQGYIYFVGEEKYRQYDGFGAGTTLRKGEFAILNHDRLTTELMAEKQLRQELILMAIQHKDVKMLEALRARENPALYRLYTWGSEYTEFAPYDDPALTRALTGAGKEILSYFTKEFVIDEIPGTQKTMIYPFLGELITALVEHRKEGTEEALRAAIAHNQYAYQKLQEGIEVTRSYYQTMYDGCQNDGARCVAQNAMDAAMERIPENMWIYNQGRVVTYRDMEVGVMAIVNITHTSAASDDPIISRLIRELNDSYDQIHALKGNV